MTAAAIEASEERGAQKLPPEITHHSMKTFATSLIVSAICVIAQCARAAPPKMQLLFESGQLVQLDFLCVC